MRYEVVLDDDGKCVTTRLRAASLEELAQLIRRFHPGATLVSCRELEAR